LILVIDCFQRRKGAAGGDTAAVCFGRAPVRRFSVRNLRGKSQGGVRGGEEEDRREKEALGSPLMTNSFGDACRRADLRRGNSAILLRLERKNEKERREEVWGSYSI
jgi:hypothetical protein